LSNGPGLPRPFSDGVSASDTPKCAVVDGSGMTADHAEEDDAEYDPGSPTPPARAPPLRSTAPQTPFTARQAGVGFAVLLLGLVVTFGLAFALA